MILPEQEAFLEWVFEIPFEDRSWRKLFNLDTLHFYRGGPVISKEAQQLDYFSRVRKYFIIFIFFSRHVYFVLVWIWAV